MLSFPPSALPSGHRPLTQAPALAVFLSSSEESGKRSQRRTDKMTAQNASFYCFKFPSARYKKDFCVFKNFTKLSILGTYSFSSAVKGASSCWERGPVLCAALLVFGLTFVPF